MFKKFLVVVAVIAAFFILASKSPRDFDDWNFRGE